MIRIRQIKIDVKLYNENTLLDKISKLLKINRNEILDYSIFKQSLDARDKNQIFYVFEVDVKVNDESKVLNKVKSNDIFVSPNLDYIFKKTGTKVLNNRPVIVGSGPAGLFATYILSENGYNPILIERGCDVDKRCEDVEKFWNENILNEESNVQFGFGGAGTFSDGKLNTLVKDECNRFRKVFNTFVENGANENILYNFRPHIGTDVLQVVLKNMKDKIIDNGGAILFNTKLTDINIINNEIKSIVVNNKEVINTDVLILAIGHSAHDTFEMLLKHGLDIESKPFAIGYRIQHKQSMINVSQYGEFYSKLLEPANYKVTYQSKNNRGIYSFCMCPGGYVVNSSSELNHLCINGMSYSKRDSENANSAIIMTVNKNDFGDKPLDGLKYVKELEKKFYDLENGIIPVQLFKDYKNNVKSSKIGNINPLFKGKYTLSNLRGILPDDMENEFIDAIEYYGTKIKGFNCDDAIIAGLESRTSSPVRIIRDNNFEANIKGIYPIGEGSGYAGGITTSAVDGIKVAEIIASIYK